MSAIWYSFVFWGPKILELILTEIKELVSLNGFKKAIKKWNQVTAFADFEKLTYIMLVSYRNYLNT